MSQPDDNIEQRLTAVERDVASLREDVTTARMLATAADREVSEVRTELRAHTQVLNALRQTQLEQGQKIDNLEREMRSLDREMRSGFSLINSGMAQITTLLEGIAGSGHNQSGD